MAEGVSASSLTPGTRPRSSLVSRVLAYIGSPNDTDAQAVAIDCLNEAILEINARVWQSLLTTSDITLDNTNITYTIPADYHDARNCMRLNSDDEESGQLPFFEPKEFEKRFPNRTTSGTVFAYTVQNYANSLVLELSTVPNTGFTGQYPKLRLRYFRNLQLLTNDSAELAAPSKMELFLLWRAREVLAAIYDPARVRYSKLKADEMWQRLVIDDNRQGMREF